eukprot:52265-Eustigmatos_ZCMA.PRE.1
MTAQSWSTTSAYSLWRSINRPMTLSRVSKGPGFLSKGLPLPRTEFPSRSGPLTGTLRAVCRIMS